VRRSSRWLWFVVAGGVGFVVDAGVLWLLVISGADPRPARLASFAAAVIVTWLINRSRTFEDRVGPPSLREFGRYLTASIAAAAVNLGIYMGLVSFVPAFAAMPVLAVAISTLASMGLNFWSYATIVFSGRGKGEAASGTRNPGRPSSGHG
jgi:putative flippase GtrA